ncbi:hypothetical protein Daus18300_004306 [Diaporthe australafricana]|uniref:RNAse P Rpr2/Rpp21 subunit domain-containing protein n=1 Tax=Diaporthe australafricana TaxID=127596 RepID=A0ABR3X9E2_9PEZI
MAKKKVPGVPNKASYCRLSFMYQAASLLAVAAKPSRASNQAAPQIADLDSRMDHNGEDANLNTKKHDRTAARTHNMSHRLLADFRSVSLKSQIRVSPDMKRTICKFCDTLLIEGQTCTSTVQNPSRGGKKPWADVLVIKCHTCHRTKRFPVNAPKSQRRPMRAAKGDASSQGAAQEPRSQPQKGP